MSEEKIFLTLQVKRTEEEFFPDCRVRVHRHSEMGVLEVFLNMELWNPHDNCTKSDQENI